MTEQNRIFKINQTLETYFAINLDVDKIPAKELMPEFIKDGVFNKNYRDGLPIRNILRELDKYGQLGLILYILPERKKKNTYWFFIRSDK